MFTPQAAQAEITYRQERIKREFARAAARGQRRALRPKRAA
ncbi:MAG: hypothetical protein QOG10_2955 [Kribbellaceae bacterium]|jgi:hypothetical protein|nr:hypothetical protein [Kribbellaceae bacterium]